MRITGFEFGSIRIDDETYERDVVIDRGEVKRRKKGPSKRFRDKYGHTPLSTQEKIPWKCSQLIIGTGASGDLPVMRDVYAEAKRRDVEIVAVPTKQAIRLLTDADRNTNAVLHITC